LLFSRLTDPLPRLDNDFLVFRGDDHEAAAQLLKGTVVLCVSSPLKVESIQLKLTGTARYVYVSGLLSRPTPVRIC
jgi:hypothetical protein